VERRFSGRRGLPRRPRWGGGAPDDLDGPVVQTRFVEQRQQDGGDIGPGDGAGAGLLGERDPAGAGGVVERTIIAWSAVRDRMAFSAASLARR
jgi:hypothetical protein